MRTRHTLQQLGPRSQERRGGNLRGKTGFLSRTQVDGFPSPITPGSPSHAEQHSHPQTWPCPHSSLSCELPPVLLVPAGETAGVDLHPQVRPCGPTSDVVEQLSEPWGLLPASLLWRCQALSHRGPALPRHHLGPLFHQV